MAEPAKKFDITQHILVPKHTILSDEEASDVLKKFNISAVQLPAIKISDPVIKALNADAGKIIKIERKTQTGKIDYYRVVVE